MLSAILFLGVVLSAAVDSSYPPDSPATSKTFGQHELCVETFAASFYTAMVVNYGFDTVAWIEKSGTDAEKGEYDVALEALKKKDLSDAKDIAKEVSRPLASLDTVPLAVYIEKTAHEVGEFMKKYELLDTSNAITRSFEFFKHIRKQFEGLDPNSFNSYMKAVIHGLVAFVGDHGFPVEESVHDLTHLFCKEFDTVDPKTCKYGKDWREKRHMCKTKSL